MGEQKARMLAGELYVADDPEVNADRHRCRVQIDRFNGLGAAVPDDRHRVLCDLFGACGDGVDILPPFQCDYGYQISVGARSFLNYGAVVLDVAPVRIGEEVLLASNVQLLTATHPLDAATRRAGWELGAPITIQDGAWLGGGVIVCPGVTIGQNTVVGAGSVVVRDLPAGVLAVGNPARVVRSV